jgi:hypothetical protein
MCTTMVHKNFSEECFGDAGFVILCVINQIITTSTSTSQQLWYLQS